MVNLTTYVTLNNFLLHNTVLMNGSKLFVTNRFEGNMGAEGKFNVEIYIINNGKTDLIKRFDESIINELISKKFIKLDEQ